MESVDVVVIGAGASGLMAGVCLAEEAVRRHRKEKILILEAAQKPGRKLLATGNGRCNITNSNINSKKYHGDYKLARSVLEKYPAQAVMRKFSSLGLFFREEEEGRVYPYSAQASAVLDLLRFRLDTLGVEIRCGVKVSSCQKQGSVFLLSSEEGPILQARKIVLTTGGKASPQLGADGRGFLLAQKMGHTVTPLFPSLVPVRTAPERVKALKGMRSRATVRLLVNGRVWKKERGEVQFTENGLSGICMFQLSRTVSEIFSPQTRKKTENSVEISIDLMPEYSEKELLEQLLQRRFLLKEVASLDFLTGMINKRVGQEIIRISLKNCPSTVGQLTAEMCARIAAAVKDFRFPCLGVMSWQNSQVTAGGIPLTEINLDTMESEICPGLYFAGEILNVDGDCGGFNLHWAWASAMAIRAFADFTLPSSREKRKRKA